MILVDSCGWIEFFTDGPRAAEYSKYLNNLSRVITPTIILYEVYKKIKKERTEDAALFAISLINRTKLVPLTESIALTSADLSLQYSLPMADAIVYATALEEKCQIITSDIHFKDMEGVVFIV
jgi:predicted nucleic acid-binding protein